MVPGWLERAAHVGQFIRRSPEPLAFLIGAGASISSGAPSTADVESALLHTLGPGASLHTLRKRIHRINQQQKRTALTPLFDRCRPNLGYQLLASLGRQRLLLVANLNWDCMLEEACIGLGVEVQSFDLATADVATVRRRVRKMKTGVVCLHMHGMIDEHHSTSLQFGLLETLQFTAAQSALLVSEFFAKTTIIVGASLRTSVDADIDLLKCLAEAGSITDRDAKPVFVFSRERQHDAISQLLVRRTSEENVFRDDDIDFDRVMFEILGLREDAADIDIGDQYELWPSRDSLRLALAHRVTAIVGEPQIGKKTTALIIARAHASLASHKGTIQLVREPDSPSIIEHCLSQLGSNDVLVVKDAFGRDEFRTQNTEFAARLFELAGDVAKPRIVLTSRLGPWPSIERLSAIASLIRTGQMAVVCASSSFYTTRELEQYAGLVTNPSDRPSAVSAAATKRVISPFEVKQFDRPSMHRHRHQVVKDKLAFLRAEHRIAVAAVCTALQDYSTVVVSPEDLARSVGFDCGTDLVTRSCGVLRLDKLGRRSRLVLATESDRLAVNRLLLDGDLVDRIRRQSHDFPWFEVARLRWRNVRRIALNARSADRTPNDSALIVRTLDWRPSLSTFRAIRPLMQDCWDARTLAYEMARRWHTLTSGHFDQAEAAEAFLNDLVRDSALLGCSAILDACLLLENSAPPRLWAAVSERAWEIARSRNGIGHEGVLLVDSLLWKDAPAGALNTSHLIRELVMHSSEAERGALALGVLLHWNNADKWGSDAYFDANTVWTSGNPEQIKTALWSVQWHCVANSQAWRLSSDHEYDEVSNIFMKRGRHPHPMSREYFTQLKVVVTAIGRIDPGWAFYLGVSVGAIHGAWPETELLQKLLERARPGDPGVMAAILSYGPPRGLLADIRNYFANAISREALLVTLGQGLDIDGVRLRTPRFALVDDPYMVKRELEIQWKRLQSFGLAMNSIDDVLKTLRPRTARAVKEFDVPAEQLGWIYEAAIYPGDLRALEHPDTVRFRPPSAMTNDKLLQAMVGLVLKQSALGRSRSMGHA